LQGYQIIRPKIAPLFILLPLLYTAGIIISGVKNIYADNMVKIFRVLGLIFILLGTVMLLTGGFELKRNKKVLDTRVVDVNAKETKRFSWYPYVSGAVIVGGLVLLIVGGTKKK
jgi:hypothetical protein